MNNTHVYWSFVAAAGMMLVAIAAVVYWRRKTRLPYRWFWVGAAVWTVAVAIKVATALLTAGFYGYLKRVMSFPAFVAIGGLYGGLQSSVCEIGLTWFAVRTWRSWGSNAERAIGIGIGAGAFEAFLIGLALAAATIAIVFGVPETRTLEHEIISAAKQTQLVWLAPIVERTIAILCHASTRALVILGTVYRRPGMIFWGFAIFTAIDAIATAAHLSGSIGKISIWWIELALVPFAIISIPILRWCYACWGHSGEAEPSQANQSHAS